MGNSISQESGQDYFVHESSYVDEACSIGKGTKIWHYSHILKGSKIGNNASIGQNVVIGPNGLIGNNVKIQNNVSVYEGVVLEDDVFCGPSCVFTNVINPRSAIPRKNEFKTTIIRRGTQKALAQVSAKAFHNGSLNEMAWRRQPLSEEEVLQSQMLSYPLTQYMFCSPGEGGVALILARADQAHKYTEKPIFLDSAVVRSRRFGSFEVLAPSLALEHSAGPTVDASKAAFEMAGIGPEDIDVAQLQDTESGAEIMHMAENGFCEHGEQEAMLANGDTKIDGRFPVNTDGGCLANGEPVGASGLRQVYENVVQLRGDAGARQVPNNPKTAYTHVYGAPGISGVTILSR